MTENNSYSAQVADLLVEAFSALGDGLARDPGDGREDFLEEARLKVAAAQAAAALAHAQETRILALATLAGLDPVEVDQSGELPREAYLAAAYALGLVEEDPANVPDVEALKRALTGEDDPADADLGDLS